jgi:putative transposase
VRLDWLHKLTCTLARNYAMVGMEELAVKAMTQKKKGKVGGADEVQNSGMGTAQKAGLNREILDTAPAKLMSQLRYKVEETGGLWMEAPTKMLKPSQTCPQCGKVKKKGLDERMHECEACGHREPRDVASARVVLNWALYGTPTAPESGRNCRKQGR